jgi:hypothetical protein
MADGPAPATLQAAPRRAAALDDVMLSMDVVDTLRHQESLVARELDEDAREAELLERLRRIYRDQGIDVSERILREGVTALKEKRFTYTPVPAGGARRWAELWVARGRIGKAAGSLLAVLAVAWLAYAALVRWPAQREAERARIEITQTLPSTLKASFDSAIAEARVPEAKARADELLADGNAALARGDAAGARQAADKLDALTADLRRTYDVMVVSRPGEQSGIFRIPDRNKGARNYYLIVEAIGPDGRPISLPIVNEEDGKTETVSKWGVRVPQVVYDAIARDKADDGIIQNRKVGTKKRGALAVDWTVAVSGGALTRW